MELCQICIAWLEVATQELASGELGGERGRTRARVGGVLVVDHRALAGRIVDEAMGEPQLEHAFARRRVRGGLGERVPGTKPHVDKVA